MSFKKEVREAVHQKYGGRCAYCGSKIEYKDMQIDHLIPRRNYGNKYTEEQIECFENYMPSCRTCNHYKRANSLDAFRKMIEEIPRKLRQNYIYKVGILYSNVIDNTKPIKFYFEQIKEDIKNDI